MATLAGPWYGSGTVKGRILLSYTITYDADHTTAVIAGTFWIETNNSISDTVNSWAVSGAVQSHTGSNLSVVLGSGGGQKAFYSFSQLTSNKDVAVAGSMSNLEAIGVTVVGSFTIPVGAMAPYLTSNYWATGITPTSFTTAGLSAYGNNSALNGTQVQWNTSPTDVGCGQQTWAAWQNVTIGGLVRATTYYFRVRPSNTAYGWGAWGAWTAFTTLSTTPSGPYESWYPTGITSNSVTVAGNGVPDNGGSGLTNWGMEVNTNASDTNFAASGNGSSCPTIGGLYRATTYYIRIVAGNGNGWGPWSAWKTFTTLSLPPGPPAESWYMNTITQVSADVTNISVPDNGGAGLDQILVRYSTDPSFASYTDIAAAGGATAVSITGLIPGTTYYVRIYAHNGNGYSPATSTKSFTTLPGVYVNVGGVWKNAVPYVNVGGVWKQAIRYVNVGGVWKQ